MTRSSFAHSSLTAEVSEPLRPLPAPLDVSGADAPPLYVKAGLVSFSGLRLPVRMVVVPLGAAAAPENTPLLVYSAIELDEPLRRELRLLGEVRFVLAPNKIHNVFLPGYEHAYPGAQFYFAPGLRERRPSLRCDGIVDAKAAEAGLPFAPSGLLDAIVTEGNAFFAEVLLFHRPSRTLIVCDFIEYFLAEDIAAWGRERLAARALGWFVDAIGEPICSPEHSVMCVDSDAFAHTRDRLLALKPLRIVMCHGHIIDGEASCRQAIEGATSRVLEKARGRWPATKALLRWTARFAG